MGLIMLNSQVAIGTTEECWKCFQSLGYILGLSIQGLDPNLSIWFSSYVINHAELMFFLRIC